MTDYMKKTAPEKYHAELIPDYRKEALANNRAYNDAE